MFPLQICGCLHLYWLGVRAMVALGFYKLWYISTSKCTKSAQQVRVDCDLSQALRLVLNKTPRSPFRGLRSVL
ncbi:hypothetical protein BV22DRAFT_622457 [Leucogyrophana mollusca]|uniref:Uncharacterized protein n=1 Tax=Leucogyrophana mollusca TaxID=85980 RepID=A0ACB8BCC6_9AGAM|nr:hypothetical protein BV22DRAFT_622457 [Leucogyrophana mollusca]